MSRMAPKRVYLMGFLCSVLGLIPYNFAKNHPDFEKSTCLVQNFMKLNMKIF